MICLSLLGEWSVRFLNCGRLLTRVTTLSENPTGLARGRRAPVRAVLKRTFWSTRSWTPGELIRINIDDIDLINDDENEQPQALIGS